jgi:diguanylate cyclase (GGDEF)-like protein
MRILIAEDDFTSRRILEAALTKWEYDVVSVTDGNEAWEKLQDADAPRMAILDWNMPGIEGVEICRKLRENKKGAEQYTYLILLSANTSKERIVSGMEAGADDYIVKPFDQHELRVRIRAEEKKLSLSMLDIDHFKNINDTHGHRVGDAVLQEFVKRIGEVIRKYDSLGRIGGEEFLIVFPGAKEAVAFKVAERVRSVIGETDFFVDGAKIRVTVSQGVATWDGNTNVDDLIAEADKALYRAKGNGRNRVEQAFYQ